MVLIDNLGDGTTFLRNIVIARIARKMHLMEKPGSGIRLIFNSCRQAGIRKPEFNENGDYVKVIFYFERTPLNRADLTEEDILKMFHHSIPFAFPEPLYLSNVHNVMYINVMNVRSINEQLMVGAIDTPGVFPHLDALRTKPFIFAVDFGIPNFTSETGIIMIRGARQYGKSTWLEQHLRQCIVDFGAGSALYLNGDEIRSSKDLIDEIRSLLLLFNPAAKAHRIYIDEITAVPDWQTSLKRCADAGELHNTLVITTGSKAADLRKGTERLPGRKGTLSRTNYYFTPLSFSAFCNQASTLADEDLIPAYTLSGGCPLAATEIITSGNMPGFITEMVRDWIYGECAASGRDRSSLIGVMNVLLRYGGSPTGQAKVAREAGLANNSVAAGYLELLMDICCLATSYPLDRKLHVPIRRKPAKYHFVNLLAAQAWNPDHPVTVADFLSLPGDSLGKWYEWLTAQEIWRRSVISGNDIPELMLFGQSKEHEIDFIIDEKHFVEVKYGRASPMEFLWFQKEYPGCFLTIINTNRFETAFCRGITMKDFLLNYL